jgi:hypothetical protein
MICPRTTRAALVRRTDARPWWRTTIHGRGHAGESASRNSRYWPETAIFIIVDDAQNGHDTVDARRTVAW